MPSYRDEYKARSKVPDASIMFFGADCIHTPAKESSDPSACPRCGGIVRDDRGDFVPNWGDDDPVRDYEIHVDANHGGAIALPMTAVCGRCGRSAWDGTTALARAKKRRLEGAPDDDTDRRDAQNRTAEAVIRGTGGKVKGRVEYKDKMAYADHMARLRQKRKVPK